MQGMDSERGGETARQDTAITQNGNQAGDLRRRDRRDSDPLFAYQGPERRSGRDRRAAN
jgi:hypothetical protein